MTNNSLPVVTFDIGGVARETGLSRDLLRIWERRYGFPKPLRDDNGARRYTLPEVARLHAIKRLMDSGMRPGRIVGCSVDALHRLAGQPSGQRGAPTVPAVVNDTLDLLRRHDAPGLQNALAGLLMQQGLQRFVLDTIIPLNVAVGEAWLRGELQIFEEHLYTEQLQVALRTAINAFPRQTGRPRVLLTTLPGEQHGLGLLMVQALLAPEAAQCISLGVQTPLEDVGHAAPAHDADIVALSFSGVFPLRRAIRDLATLRRQLPPTVALWAGGAMTRQVSRPLVGVTLIRDLPAAIVALNVWRGSAAAVVEPRASASGKVADAASPAPETTRSSGTRVGASNCADARRSSERER
jgi:hypothetical protein